MKMKNTTTSNYCNNINPLSTTVSTETSITSGFCKNVEKKKKKTFLSKVKAIFSKSSTETQNKGSGPLYNAVKNTYVVRETHGTSSNDLQIYRVLNDEANSEKCKVYYGVNVNLTGNQRINSVLVNDNNLVDSTNDNVDSAYAPAKNNGSWITTSTNTSQGTETNCRNIFTEQTTLLSSPVDVGVQTKIPSCYKVYLLHKHVSNCNRRNKLNSKIKKNIFINSDKCKRPGGIKSYYYYKYSSTQSIYTDESHGGDIMRGKININKNAFNNSMRCYETNNIDVEMLESTERFPRHSKILNIDSNCNIIIDNDDGTTFSGNPVNSSNSSSFDLTNNQKLKDQKTKVNYNTTEIKTNEPDRQEEANAEGSQSKSLPLLNILRKNRSIKEIKCNSSPLVSQNTIQTRVVKKKELIKTTFLKDTRNNKEIKNTVLQPFRNFHRKICKDTEETNKKKTYINKTTNIFSEEVSSSGSKNSNTAYEIKEKDEINSAIKMKAKGKVNKLKIKHINSNSTIITDIWQTKSSAIRNNDLNTTKINKNVIKSKEYNFYQKDKIRNKQNQTYNQNDHLIYANPDNYMTIYDQNDETHTTIYDPKVESLMASYDKNYESHMTTCDQNDHLIYANPENLKLNRKPIITQPMIFFNGNIKSERENEMSNYFFNKSIARKEKKVKNVQMKSIKKQQLINSHSNLKIPLEQQYLDPYKVNYNHRVMSSTKKYKDNATIHEPKKKFKNHKTEEIENSTSPLLAANKQKFGNFNKKNVNNPLNKETNSYICTKEKHKKKSKARFSKNRVLNCIPQLGTSGKTSKKKQKYYYTSWKPSSEILKRSNLTEISFECDLQNSLFHKNEQANKKTQKNWNENCSSNNKSNSENKFNKDSKHFNQEIRMFHDIQAEKLLLKDFSSNAGVHGAFSGNITSKRKTFFAKITPMHTNK